MVKLSISLVAVALLAATAGATVVASAAFTDAKSSHWQGDPWNATVTFNAEASFTLGGISWDGTAEPQERRQPRPLRTVPNLR